MATVELNLETMLPATFTAPDLTEAQFLKICNDLPDARVEYEAGEGTIILMPPTDFNTGHKHSRIHYQLFAWEMAHGGQSADSSASFLLPNGSRRSPDASWADAERWKQAQSPNTLFPPFAPDFVIEVRSPSDRLRPLREKMEEYIANGVQLGWLIDPKEGTVTIYRTNQPPELLDHPAEVRGDGPMEGFVLNLTGILD